MPEHSHAVLDDPLVQVDHLLREVALALVPDREPAPPARPRPAASAEPPPEPPPEPPEPPGPSASPRGRPGPLAEVLERAHRQSPEPEPEPAPAKPPCCHADLSAELSELADLKASLEELRASLDELLQGYRGALVQSLAVSAPPLQSLAASAPAPADPARANEFSLVAGPFVALEAVRAFERTLLELPGIEQVALRGYEGADRAIVDVRLTPPNS